MFKKGDIVNFSKDRWGRYKNAKFQILKEKRKGVYQVRCIQSDDFEFDMEYEMYESMLSLVLSKHNHPYTTIFQ